MKKKLQALIWVLFFTLSLTLSSYFIPLPVQAQPVPQLRVISYNVESDEDTQPALVTEDIERIGEADLWGLSEVQDREVAEIFRAAISTPNQEYTSLLGTTGRADRLQIVYNPNKLRLINSQQLTNSPGTRKPLMGHFQFILNGQELLFVVNHFNRGDEERRNQQAVFFRQWAQTQTLPIIAVGDYNFDYEIPTGQGNAAFDTLLEDNTFTWIRPQCLGTNTCPDTGTQCNSRYHSILDFVFVANGAKNWRGESDILLINEPVCARERNGFSDHRPIAANFIMNNE